jgi:hypothetical protein
VYSIQREYSVVDSSQQSASTSAGDENSQQQQPQPQQRKFVDLTANKFSGVGPVSQEGVPIALRSVINQRPVERESWHLLRKEQRRFSINSDDLKRSMAFEPTILNAYLFFVFQNFPTWTVLTASGSD